MASEDDEHGVIITCLADVKRKLFEEILGRSMHLDESYTCKILYMLYSRGIKGSSLKVDKRTVVMLLYAVITFCPFIPSYISFVLILCAYTLYVLNNRECERKFSDFDVLLVLFSFVVISVASVGKPLHEIVTAVLVYGSFITLYFIVVNMVDSKQRLFDIKFLYCISGAVIAVIQLVQNILSFEMAVLGQIYVLCVPMALELFFETENKRVKAVLVFMSMLMLIALTICWSGGSWVWATFILAYFVVIKNWKLLLVGGAALLFMPLILPGEIINFAQIAENGIVDYLLTPSEGYRISVFRAVSVLLDYYKNYQIGGKWYASVLIFVCMIFITVFLIREIVFNMKQARAGMVCAVLAAVGCGVTGFIYSGIGNDMWKNYSAMLVFWSYTSIYSAQAHMEMRKDGEIKESKSKKAHFCFIDMLPILLAVAFFLTFL